MNLLRELILVIVTFSLALPGAAASEEQAPARNATAPADTVLTLAQCVDIALKKNPELVAAAFSVDASASRVGQARSGYYPQVNASASYTRIQPASAATSTLGRVRVDAYDVYSSSITLNQKLLDFGKTSSQVDAAKYGLESTRSDLQTSQDAVILSVKQAYYGVLQARRNRDVAADVIKQFQLHLEQAKGFYEVGTRAKIDVIKAEVDLSNAKLSLINAENALSIAWVTLTNAMGAPDAQPFMIEDDLSFHKFDISQEAAMKQAFESRPDLQSLIARRQAAEMNVSTAQSGHYPVLSGVAEYGWDGTRASSLEDSWSAGVVLTFPLFNGFLTSQQAAEAKANLYVLKANEEALRQQVLLEVRQAFLNLQAADASIGTAELAARQAKENLDLANGRYAAGVGSPVEVSDAFATYVTAQANYTNSLLNYKLAQASIEKSMGAR